jgi:fatty acid desaturase
MLLDAATVTLALVLLIVVWGLIGMHTVIYGKHSPLQDSQRRKHSLAVRWGCNYPIDR